MRTVFRIFSYLRQYPLLATCLLSCAVLMALMSLVFPETLDRVISDAVPAKDGELLLKLVGIALFGFAVYNGLNALRIIINNTLEQKVIFDLRSDLYRRIQRLPMRWFDEKRTGDVMTRVTEDVTATERVLIDGIEIGVIAVLQMLAVGVYLFIKDVPLALVALIPVPFLVFGALAYTRTAPQRHRRVRSATSEMNSLLHDNLDGIQQVKAFTREEIELGRFNESSNKLRMATLHMMRVWAAYNPSMEFLRNLGLAIVVGYGGWRLIQGEITIGDLSAFIVLVTMFYEPISRLHGLNNIIQAGRAAAERVFEIMDTDEEPDLDVEKSLPTPIRGDVSFDNVVFSYDPEIPTLKGIDLRADAGQMVALVGHTGAGKSTIINLLTRFYEHDSGIISIDGTDITSINKTSLREVMGYVTQESFLFNGTVRENMNIAIADASEEEMWAALEAANAADFVRAFPKQLDTVVGERGVKLSVGEKQRIAIARVILRNPPILLLDEATASVDTETERLIQLALDQLMQNRTSFVIAHRLSTVRNADVIYVLDHGEVAERGNHDSLIQQDGIYAELCRTSLIADAE